MFPGSTRVLLKIYAVTENTFIEVERSDKVDSAKVTFQDKGIRVVVTSYFACIFVLS